MTMDEYRRRAEEERRRTEGEKRRKEICRLADEAAKKAFDEGIRTAIAAFIPTHTY